jgi:hypothetical protein
MKKIIAFRSAIEEMANYSDVNIVITETPLIAGGSRQDFRPPKVDRAPRFHHKKSLRAHREGANVRW